MPTTAPAIGTQVMITGISPDSPMEVLNGRTGIVVAHGNLGLVTVSLTYAVTADDIALAFGSRGTVEDFTEDETGHRVDMLARYLVDAPEFIDPDGETAQEFVRAALLEIRGMARRSDRGIWQVVRDMVTAERIRAELDYRITTKADARAWVHHRVNTDQWGF